MADDIALPHLSDIPLNRPLNVHYIPHEPFGHNPQQPIMPQSGRAELFTQGGKLTLDVHDWLRLPVKNAAFLLNHSPALVRPVPQDHVSRNPAGQVGPLPMGIKGRQLPVKIVFAGHAVAFWVSNR